jgi:hypothetical protein
VNADKTKHMVMSRDQDAGRSHIIKLDRQIDRYIHTYVLPLIHNSNDKERDRKRQTDSQPADKGT